MPGTRSVSQFEGARVVTSDVPGNVLVGDLTCSPVAVLRPDPARDEEPSTLLDLVALEVAAAAEDDDPTSDLYPESPADRPSWHVRLFGTHEFFRLWLVQVVSALGDWLGFSAIILLAAKVGGSGAGAGAISLVMAARIIPGFLFGPVAGVLVDRWDRKKTMVACDLGRAAVIACLPFVDNLFGLVLVSLALEVFTLLWSPAKDATVPNLVPPDHLTTANSLSLAAAYGTFPFAALLFAALAGVSSWLSGISALSFLRLDQMSLALYVDVCTFLFAALDGARPRDPQADARSNNRPTSASIWPRPFMTSKKAGTTSSSTTPCGR